MYEISVIHASMGCGKSRTILISRTDPSTTATVWRQLLLLLETFANFHQGSSQLILARQLSKNQSSHQENLAHIFVRKRISPAAYP